MATNLVRIAAVGDLHCSRASQGVMEPLFTQMAQQADIIVLCGDLTDYGRPEEAQILARAIAGATKVPIIAVLGNHDHESGHADEVARILREAGLIVLDGDAREVLGIGFAGTKGFAGGFDDRTLQPWGETAIKAFVQEAANEALKLESALAKLRSSQRIAVLHYAPIRGTVEGEPPEILPFLGSSRLAEPVDRHGVTMVLHGHAHSGAPEGHTPRQVPVYNVSLPVLSRAFPDRPPFRMFELPTDRMPTKSPDEILRTAHFTHGH